MTLVDDGVSLDAVKAERARDRREAVRPLRLAGEEVQEAAASDTHTHGPQPLRRGPFGEGGSRGLLLGLSIQRAERLVLSDSGGASLVVVSRGGPSRYEPQAVIVERLVLRLHVVRC